MWKKNVFYIGIIVAASGLIGPPLALAAGLAFGLSTVHTFHGEGRKLSKFLLQAAVVCLGFGMNLKEVVHAGASGFMYTAISMANGGPPVYSGQIFVFFVMTVAAAEVAVGLALIVTIFRTKHSIDIDAMNSLKG